ncbi:hypothetical protein EUTSA_v10019855mg [Eutrema salsugineum]|uniref:FKB95-like N-terminal Kelch domain-containing protein n=2 Tax=Eutrema salsugineum TaxID=72664 RepID=V4M9W3_EUTSA|nr:hypothetical protein EUTSA_v10019855mg [Eutrema salsugineum]
MRMARASASASLVDGKIYVIGGCGMVADSQNWGEIFHLKTQTWEDWFIPNMDEIHQSVVIKEEKKVYVVDEARRVSYLSPGNCKFWTLRKMDSKPGHRSDWCALGKLLYCRDSRGRILWCEPHELDWKQVKGLEELQHLSRSSASTQVSYPLKPCSGTTSFQYDICRLCSNSAGNIVIFWNAYLGGLELWSAEISMEKREGCEIWGKICSCLQI